MAIAFYWLIYLLKLELELSRVYHPHLISPLPPQTKIRNLSVPDFNRGAVFFFQPRTIQTPLSMKNFHIKIRPWQDVTTKSMKQNLWSEIRGGAFFFCRGDFFRWFVRCLKGVVWGMFGLNFKLEKKNKYQQKILDVWVGWFSIEEI